jgi:hypothetical protein
MVFAADYLDPTGNAAFLCESENESNQDGYGLIAESAKCLCCQPPVPCDPDRVHKVLSHVGAHILFDKSLDLTLELCGLCLRPLPNCIFYLRKGKGTGSSCQVDHRKTRCPNLRRFAYLSAATEAPNSPCTNVPIICPLCPSSAGTIWKYNAQIHFSKHHPSTVLSDHLYNITISTSEQAALQMK